MKPGLATFFAVMVSFMAITAVNFGRNSGKFRGRGWALASVIIGVVVLAFNLYVLISYMS